MNEVKTCLICNRILFSNKTNYCRLCSRDMKIIHGYRFFKMDKLSLGKKRFFVAEHRLVMENALGRFLNGNESIHHIDGNKLNNDINNLMLFPTNKEHISFHTKIKQFGLTNNILNEIENNRNFIIKQNIYKG